MTRLRGLPLLVRTVLHAFGVRGLLRRLAYEAQFRTGVLARRLPVADGYDHLTPVTWQHRFDLAAIRAGYTAFPDAAELPERLRTDVARLLAGRQTLYGALDVEAGWPPRWDTDPLSGTRWPRAHWTAVPDDAPHIGDIKDVWELSRLPATFPLARAYAATGDESYPDAWWAMLEDWMAENPPNLGVDWRCGQETSLRAIAIQFGLSTFAASPSSTPDRISSAGRLLAAPQFAAEIVSRVAEGSSTWTIARRETASGTVLWRGGVASRAGLLLLDGVGHGLESIHHVLAVVAGSPRLEIVIDVDGEAF